MHGETKRGHKLADLKLNVDSGCPESGIIGKGGGFCFVVVSTVLLLSIVAATHSPNETMGWGYGVETPG